MKIRNSLKSLKSRHRDCRVIRRRGRTYVINKTNRRFKARQANSLGPRMLAASSRASVEDRCTRSARRPLRLAFAIRHSSRAALPFVDVSPGSPVEAYEET